MPLPGHTPPCSSATLPSYVIQFHSYAIHDHCDSSPIVSDTFLCPAVDLLSIHLLYFASRCLPSRCHSSTQRCFTLPLPCASSPCHSVALQHLAKLCRYRTTRVVAHPFRRSPIRFDAMPLPCCSLLFHDDTLLRHQRYSLTDLRNAFPLPFHTVPVLDYSWQCCSTAMRLSAFLFRNPSMPHNAIASPRKTSPLISITPLDSAVPWLRITYQSPSPPMPRHLICLFRQTVSRTPANLSICAENSEVLS